MLSVRNDKLFSAIWNDDIQMVKHLIDNCENLFEQNTLNDYINLAKTVEHHTFVVGMDGSLEIHSDPDHFTDIYKYLHGLHNHITLAFCELFEIGTTQNNNTKGCNPNGHGKPRQRPKLFRDDADCLFDKNLVNEIVSYL